MRGPAIWSTASQPGYTLGYKVLNALKDYFSQYFFSIAKYGLRYFFQYVT
jgi:hypothetical protein